MKYPDAAHGNADRPVVRTEMREAFAQQFPEGEAPILGI